MIGGIFCVKKTKEKPMKNMLFVFLVIALSACDINKYDYILNKTAFCNKTSEEIFVCKDVTQKLLSGRIIEYFPDGKNTKNYFTVKDGKLNGKHISYYENGQVKWDGAYKDGKEEGFIKVYYENGVLKREVFFQDGKLNGFVKDYYENGKIKTVGYVNEGKLSGPFWSYTNFGLLMSEIEYKMGKMVKSRQAPETELKLACKKHFNLCSQDNRNVGCRKKLSGKISSIEKNGVFVDYDAFVYTTKKYISNEKIDSKYYYEYVDTVEYAAPNGLKQRVRAYKETNEEALCDDLYKPFRELGK